MIEERTNLRKREKIEKWLFRNGQLVLNDNLRIVTALLE